MGWNLAKGQLAFKSTPVKLQYLAKPIRIRIPFLGPRQMTGKVVFRQEATKHKQVISD